MALPLPAAGIPCDGMPLLLKAGGSAVDLFFTATSADGSPGPRRPVCRIPAGASFLAAPLPAELRGWQAAFVPLPDSRCQPVADDERVAALEDWLARLLRAARPGLVPTDYRDLAGADGLDLEDAEVAASSGGPRWIEVAEGRVRLMGLAGIGFGAGDLVCLPADGWLVADGPARLGVAAGPAATPAMFAGPAAAPAMAAAVAMQAALLRARVLVWAGEDRAAGQRLALRRGQAGRRVGVALASLAGLLDRARKPLAGAEGDDPVLAACRLAGEPLGIALAPLPQAQGHRTGADRLAALADASGVQRRRVALRGVWWREDAGPLVAFADDTGEPVALLPLPGGGYQALFPASGHRQAVDEGLAAGLRPHAHAFFRSFPARALGLPDLLRLGMAGLRRETALALLMALGLGLLGMVAPLALGHLFDRVIPSAERGQLVEMLAALAGVALATLGFSLYRAELMLRLQGRMDGAVQAAVWDRVLKLPARFFRDHAAGDLAQRINAINQVHQELSGTALGGLLSGLFAFLNLALLFSLAPHLAWPALGLVAAAVLANAGLALLIIGRERQQQAVQGKLSSLALELLTGIAKLRVAAAESRGFARWADLYRQAWGAEIAARRLAYGAQMFTAAFSVIALAVIFDAAAGQESGSPGRLSIGDFVAFVGVYTSFFLQFVSLADLLLSLLHLLPQLERARPILAAMPESAAAGTGSLVLGGAVSVSQVSFRYQPDGPAILDGLSFDLREGEFLAVVGPSGSGKSTLMRLLLGFERAEAGSIRYDGKDLADLDLPALRRQMGVVLQSGQLMPGDIYSNIVGAHNLSVDDAWEAARRCGLDADIEAMPMGMHTLIGEGATTLSGGQRQRILIARAIVRRPRLLLFDEATSALDNRTQEIVSRSVERLKATRVVIAHRLSTIVNADRILVLDRGRVVQSGTYAELMEQPGLFRDLASRQLA